jgi:Iron-containing redox enzyme
MLSLPSPRGPATELLIGSLRDAPGALGSAEGLPGFDQPLVNEDLQLALYLCYELHYRGLPGVDDGWEWDPSLLALRRDLELCFEDALLEAVPRDNRRVPPSDIDLSLRAISEEDAPSLSSYVKVSATLEEVREFVVHRSAYQLKEADPHSWVIPRLSGRPKAALLEVQFDEYGEARAELMHAALFARTMDALELDSRYGAYLDVLPGVTLATVNLMSLFGLHRRWRGAIVGHLAAFEMSSSLPNRRYSNGLLRLGGGPEARRFYDVHVLADAVHENIAAVDLAGGLARADPGLAGDVLFGARCLVATDGAFAAHLVECWGDGHSSLHQRLLAGT